MINIIIILFMSILYIYFFFKLYFINLNEFLNLFFEIKNFFLQKINLNSSFLETNIETKDQQFDLNKFENQNSFNKKEKILVILSCIVISGCIYIFFKNNVPSVEILNPIQEIQSIIPIVQTLPIIPIPEVPEIFPTVPAYESFEYVKNIIDHTFENDEKFRNCVLFSDFKVRYNWMRFSVMLNISESLSKGPFEVLPLQESQRLIELFNAQIYEYLFSKRT